MQASGARAPGACCRFQRWSGAGL